jgi:hypothetical protein
MCCIASARAAARDDGHASLRQTLYENMVRPPAPAIAGGTYFTYFSVPGRPDYLMRSVTFVRREAELVTFRRVTRWAPGDRQGGAKIPGNHYGVAISRLNWIHFNGVNRRQTGEASIMAVQWAPILGAGSGRQRLRPDRIGASVRVCHHAAGRHQDQHEAGAADGAYRQARRAQRGSAGGQFRA